jgi:hypothetical protein
MVTRHELLARLHHLLAPQLYVETGVHTGASLNLAACRAIGIDPNPLVYNLRALQSVAAMTSDEYFASNPVLPGPIDLGFIDGMHLYEYAWRDFNNMEQRAGAKSVIVFDDMLPMNQHMTSREMVLGDWTGDVWKVYYMLRDIRDDLTIRLVDTFPTGTMVVWNLDPNAKLRSDIPPNPTWEGGDEVPEEILFRTESVTADRLIEELKEWRG